MPLLPFDLRLQVCDGRSRRGALESGRGQPTLAVGDFVAESFHLGFEFDDALLQRCLVAHFAGETIVGFAARAS